MALLQFCFLLCFTHILAVEYKEFPKEFAFGVGTSAYQIEGAWNVSGKGESIFDHQLHLNSSKVLDESNGDIACDSYHKYKRDIEMVKELKVKYYRFSISWPRLLPTGTVNYVNPDGVNYYNNLINGLLEEGITPMVTMFHWDTPQVLESLGGWNSEQMVPWFKAYADKLYELFGDRVKMWITFNEPTTYCYYLYENTGIGSYLCGHNLIKAHAAAYNLYQWKYKRIQRGRVGFTVNVVWTEPKDPKSESDRIAARNFMDSNLGWFAWPIYKTGDYPLSMKRAVARRSKEQGFPISRLPKFTLLDRLAIYKSYDFIGINYYSTFDCTFAHNPTSVIPTKRNDDDITVSINPAYKTTSVPFFTLTPSKLTDMLVWLSKELPGVEMIITENGYNGDADGSLDDQERVDYINTHLQATLDAMNQGAKITGYMYWSLMDNFEWHFGYTRKFGIYAVDFNDPNRTRTPRKSAMVFQNIVVTRKIDTTFNPKNFAH